MDHVKTALPRLQVCNKMIYGHGKFPITLIGMIRYGHEDEKYAQYSNELKPNNPNFTIGSLLWILRCVHRLDYWCEASTKKFVVSNG